MYLRHLITGLIVGLCVINVSNAQEGRTQLTPAQAQERQRVEALLQSSYTHINGKETPELVPFTVRMQHFFYGYKQGIHQAALKPLLSAEDDAVLTEFANRHAQELKQHEKEYEAAWMEIASRAQHMSAMEIAAAMKSATDKSHQAQEVRYRSVLAQLSQAGRTAVNEYAFAKVRPQVSIEDPFVVASADPVFYKDQLLKGYEMVRSGKYPPLPSNPEARAAGAAPAVTTSSTEDARVGYFSSAMSDPPSSMNVFLAIHRNGVGRRNLRLHAGERSRLGEPARIESISGQTRSYGVQQRRALPLVFVHALAAA